MRDAMVREQLEKRGIHDERVLAAMRQTPRHLFVQEALQAQAYKDHALPIGHGQTISQPYIVGLMSQMLEIEPEMRVLEIGAGSGYQAAVLAAMGCEVYTVERIRDLYVKARQRLLELRYFKVKLKLDDGTMGWAEEAPFDRILVTAGGPDVPMPLVEQLADPGILIIPVGGARRNQQLVVIRKQDGALQEERHGGVAFVDLVGKHGW